MLELCRNRSLGDNIRIVNGGFLQGLRILTREYLTEVSTCLKCVLPFIAIATAALWFAIGDCVILRDGKEACVVLLAGARVRRVAS